MGVIPISIAIGIIEDKIANDFSGYDIKTLNSLKRHLNDVKEKISQHEVKAINKICKVYLSDDGLDVLEKSQYEIDDFKNYSFQNEFICFEKNDGTKRIIKSEFVDEIYITFEELTDEEVLNKAQQQLKNERG